MIIENKINAQGVLRTVDDKGYAVVSNIDTLEAYLQFASELGSFVTQGDAEECSPYVLISEGNQINKLGFSSNELFPHTDRSILQSPPDLVLLWCKQSAKEGGESTFVDMKSVLDNLKLTDYCLYRELLQISAVFSDENFSDFYHSNVFYKDGTSTYLRFRNDNYIFLAPRYHHVFERLVEIIRRNMATYLVNSGEAIIINNKRVLHGRKKFTGHRELYRLHINTVNRMRGCCIL